MKDTRCRRCRATFLTSMPGSTTVCPYCGYAFEESRESRRKAERSEMVRDCVISAEGAMVKGRTVDISALGVGVRFDGTPPISAEDRVRVVMDEFELDSPAVVIWASEEGARGGTRLGLSFDKRPE